MTAQARRRLAERDDYRRRRRFDSRLTFAHLNGRLLLGGRLFFYPNATALDVGVEIARDESNVRPSCMKGNPTGLYFISQFASGNLKVVGGLLTRQQADRRVRWFLANSPYVPCVHVKVRLTVNIHDFLTLSASGVAERSSYTREWIWRLARRAEIPDTIFAKSGKQCRFLETPELIQWCEQRRRENQYRKNIGQRTEPKVKWSWTEEHNE